MAYVESYQEFQILRTSLRFTVAARTIRNRRRRTMARHDGGLPLRRPVPRPLLHPQVPEVSTPCVFDAIDSSFVGLVFRRLPSFSAVVFRVLISFATLLPPDAARALRRGGTVDEAEMPRSGPPR